MQTQRAVVIIPTRNERETIAEIIPLVLQQQDCMAFLDIELLIVDGDSTDGTIEYVSELSHQDARIHLIVLGRRGLGLALMQAYEHAFNELGADYVAQMDADLSHAPSHLPDLFEALRSGYDLSIGSRYAPGGGTSGWPASRRLQSLLANRFASLASGYGEVREWTSGYRAFSSALYRQLDFKSIGYHDYTIQPALVLDALRNGARVREVPITFVNRKWGKSKLPLFGYTFHLLKHFGTARLRNPRRAGQPWPLHVPE
jgi:dolichol-phosphate mannosyltransferase